MGEAFLWWMVPLGAAVLVALVGRGLSARRGAHPPVGVVPDVAGPARRLVASLVNWVATLAAVLLLARSEVSLGRLLLVVPVTRFLLEAVAGAGPGELVAGTRVVDAESGRHLGPARTIVRVVVQLMAAYAFGLFGWLVGAMLAVPVALLVGRAGIGAIFLGIIIGTPLALVLAEPFLVLVTPRHTTLWDFAAHSAVVRRDRAVTPPLSAVSR